ncbi:MAG: macro domain-containing protein [Ruminococcus sp.]
MTYREEKLDLFLLTDSHWLAHCISADFALGAGIAKEFAKRFDEKRFLSENRDSFPAWNETGFCIPDEQNHVLNLVTKKGWRNKPTLLSLEQALQSMAAFAAQNAVTKIAMPKIGCGLDRLHWEDVSPLIQQVFAGTEMEIIVCYLD